MITFERDVAHPKHKDRRDKLRDLDLCINGPLPGSAAKFGRQRVEHGPVISGGKCQRCINVHKGLNPDGTEKPA